MCGFAVCWVYSVSVSRGLCENCRMAICHSVFWQCGLFTLWQFGGMRSLSLSIHFYLSLSDYEQNYKGGSINFMFLYKYNRNETYTHRHQLASIIFINALCDGQMYWMLLWYACKQPFKSSFMRVRWKRRRKRRSKFISCVLLTYLFY